MAKAKVRKRAARKAPDSLTLAVALERARLKRMVQAKRDVARLTNELRRAMYRSDVALRQFALDVAKAQRPDVIKAWDELLREAPAGEK